RSEYCRAGRDRVRRVCYIRARRIPRAAQRYARYRVAVLQLSRASAELGGPVGRKRVSIGLALVSGRDVQLRCVHREGPGVICDGVATLFRPRSEYCRAGRDRVRRVCYIRARRIPRAGQRYARYRVAVLQLSRASAELGGPVGRERVSVGLALVSGRDRKLGGEGRGGRGGL